MAATLTGAIARARSNRQDNRRLSSLYSPHKKHGTWGREMAEASRAAFTGWGRVIDYLFGRNALIGLASAMLLIISGYATWSGMNDFIVGASASKGRDLPGGFSVSHTHLVVAVTIALTFLMWIALRESIGAQRRLIERLITFPLYIFLVLWSVGFGYGSRLELRILCDGTARNMTWPAGWKFVGAAAPASIAANKTALLHLWAFGLADTDVVAQYIVEP